ncbi:hypothetical protein C8R41DRAFT_866122 [Lentinula lateritia]|uniref:Uncharacterized protein n=1 Tax=Lentinula lateritia TaxID=40482 RepID=A0ABQ8VK34_9AGAR|nr:hypothetical protein C8R41DRAFT_866122 [Lentinula lateritia]
MLAKPSSNSSLAFSLCETSSFAQSMSECTRKRKRQAEDDDFDPLNPQNQDDKNKTRRINPFKLAERLPDGLVKEMETFIKPGAIMPNFDVRKELQIRYQVDRRHLYDYFHSRGLRVAKEDRHSNLTRSRIAKAKAQTNGDEGVKENVSQKFYKPMKLPPAKRSAPKPKISRKSYKKPVLMSTVENGVFSSSPTTYNQEPDVPATASVEEDFSPENGTNIPESDIYFNSDVDAVTNAATLAVMEQQPCFYSEDAYVPSASGPSTPSLVDDSSSCKSPSPSLEEESFSAAEFAAEFLNLPEDLDCQDQSMDTVFDCSFAPSIIGDLMRPSDRKNMYEHIDTNIVSNGTSFALDLSALEHETSSLNPLFADTALPSFYPSLSLASYLSALQDLGVTLFLLFLESRHPLSTMNPRPIVMCSRVFCVSVLPVTSTRVGIAA